MTKRSHGIEDKHHYVLRKYAPFTYKGYKIIDIEKWYDDDYQDEIHPTPTILMVFNVEYKGKRIVSDYHTTSQTKKDLIDFCKYAINHNDHFLIEQ